MSHQIKMIFFDKSLYVSTCHDLKQSLLLQKSKLNEISKNDFEIQNLLSETEEILNFISNQNNQINELDFMNFQRKLSTLEKNVANSQLMTKNILSKDLIDYLNSAHQTIDMQNEISSHGLIAIETFEYLEKNDIKKTKENFNKYLSIIEQEKLSKDKILKYINHSFNIIEQSNLHEDLKFQLKTNIKKIENTSNLKDINSIIQNKINEANRTKEFAIKFSKLLSNQGFSIQPNSQKWYLNEESSVVLKMAMKNKNNNVVQMYITSNNEIKYKLGNYIGHACEKTTERLINDLKKAGIVVSNITVKRDFNENFKFEKAIERGK